jgi:hypothetical protein
VFALPAKPGWLGRVRTCRASAVAVSGATRPANHSLFCVGGSLLPPIANANHFVTTGGGASTGGGALPLPTYTATSHSKRGQARTGPK